MVASMFESLSSFKSNGLSYRFLNEDDKSFFVSLYTSPEVMKYICTPYTKDEAELLFKKTMNKQLSGNSNKFVWLASDSNGQVGLVGLTKIDKYWDIGAVLSSSYLGKGSGKKVMSNLLSKLFREFSIQQITGTIPVGNVPCVKSVEKLGFTFMGVSRGDAHVWYLERDKFIDED